MCKIHTQQCEFYTLVLQFIFLSRVLGFILVACYTWNPLIPLQIFLNLLILESDKGGVRKTSICCSTYLCIHRLILVCALIGGSNPQPWCIGKML